MQPTPPAAPGAGHSGGGRMATSYYDDAGRLRRAREHGVPVDQYGVITSAEYRCPRCKATKWHNRATVAKGVPACEVDNRRMVRLAVKSPPMLPWKALWRTQKDRMWAVLVGLGVAGVGAAVDGGQVPAAAVAVSSLPAGVVGWRVAARVLTRRAVGQNRVDPTQPESGRRVRNTIARRARAVGYCAAVGCGWLALVAGVGLDPAEGGRVAWPALVAVWAYPALTWWRHVRNRQPRPTPAPEVVEGPAVDPDETQTRRVWSQILAPEQGEVLGRGADGNPVKTKRAGKLPGTWLEDWHRVEGGWAATVVGPDGTYTSDTFLAARPAIAAAYKMKAIMVTIIPDEEDENRALVSTQRTTPIRDDVRWTGPDSIDVANCRAPIAQYKDGTLAYYEIYRRDWGTPHDFLCGTTGAGKSETLNLLLTIDRWTHHTDEQGRTRGLVADLLIDPQQGQSYGPFLDDLAAPVATSLEEATLLVQALRNEMRRRNRYLARVPWPDPKRRNRDGTPVMRKGRKWWNPLVDGPIITLNIDEAHEFLADRAFAKLVTSGARMYRKCGIRIRVATHTPLLADLGGSMALRSMLTGGFVWVGRTADSLSGPVAFNGRLQVDPRTIPEVPGMAFLLSGLAPKPMLVRSMWEPDFYDWVRDDYDEPIGYPAALPPETLAAFGAEFAAWAADPDGAAPTPGRRGAESETDPASGVRCVDAVLAALRSVASPVDMNELDAVLRGQDASFSTRTVREALRRLREAGQVFTSNNRHELTPQAREVAAAEGGGAP